MKKYNVLILVLFAFLIHPGEVSGQSQNLLIYEFLNSVTTRSHSMKSLESTQKARLADLVPSTAALFTTGYLKSSFYEEQTAPLSPFSPLENQRTELGLGVSKQWATGFSTEVTYNNVDNETLFPAGFGQPFFAFQSPTLELKLKSSLIRDLFNGRYRNLLKTVERQKDLINIETKNDMKLELLQSLFDYSKALEIRQSLDLQKLICQKTRTQSNKLKAKKRKGLVSKREYLLSQQELLTCEATIEDFQKKLIEAQNNFLGRYNFNLSSFMLIDAKNLFSQVQAIYKNKKGTTGKSNVDDTSEVQEIKANQDYLAANQDQLDALASPNLELEVRGGSVGVNDTFNGAQSDLFDANNPFFYVGMKLDLPLTNREAEARAVSNRYRLKALQSQKEQLKAQVASRILTLKSSIQNDLNIYRKYSESVDLARQVYLEADKDFKRGRLDFVDLSEFSKSLIANQRTLSSHRLAVLNSMVEYLNYFNYFDSYLTTASERAQ